MAGSHVVRRRHLDALSGLLDRFPVVGLLGARQVGKTTLARDLAASGRGLRTTFFDLEDPADLARLAEPILALRELEGLVVIDEVQRRPELFPALRVLADRPGAAARFLVLGSASPDLLKQTSESLAGRIFYHELGGFALDEVGMGARDRLWVRGGFPRSFLGGSDAESAEWRQGFIRTFLERDLPQFGVAIPAATLRRFWTMLAHYHGQVWNGAEIARAFGIAGTTVRRYLDTLTAALVLRQLQPWFANIAKRQVRSPKIYIADSGLLHALLNLETLHELAGHPKVGASWEGFALGEVTVRLGARDGESFFWATHGGAELDLLVVRGNRRLGFEFKRTDAPRLSPSIRSALADLQLDRVDVVHAGDHSFPLAERVRALALSRIYDDLEPLG
ncbi:MAG TPA: ATP-binding protein [Thermoanaerobaculia bacterium]|nr:ATP-binding protein [Thermoanaerobaculia bacterium]